LAVHLQVTSFLARRGVPLSDILLAVEANGVTANATLLAVCLVEAVQPRQDAGGAEDDVKSLKPPEVAS